MKQSFLLLLVCALLAACTGTFEAQPPIILIVGQQDDSGLGQISLYDSAVISNSVESDLRAPFVSRTLPLESQPVDYDIADRLLERTEIFVLSRAGDSTDGFQHYLSRYNLENLDIAEPDSFQMSSGVLDLSMLSSEDLTSFPDVLCLTQIVVERADFAEPRYAVFVNDAEACGGVAEDNGLLVLDLEEELWLSFVTTIASENIAVAAIVLDQRSNQLFVPTQFLGQVKIRSLSVPELTTSGFEVEVSVSPSQLRDLGIVSDQLVILANEQFFYSSDLSAGATLESQATTELSLRLVTDESLRDSRVYITATNRFTVHESVSDEDEQSRSISPISGATLDANAFMYLLSDGRVQRFDTLIYDGSFNTSFSSIFVPDVVEPVFASWAFADFASEAE